MTKSLKNNLGLILVWVLALFPLVLWLFMKPLADRFFSSGATFRSLGQLTGLLGMALLSLNFVLAARFKFLDIWFMGLNRVYIKHHIIGALSFCLLLFHPTFLIIQYIFISLKYSFDFILLFGSWPLFFGKLGLLVFVVLMAVTFYFNFKYQSWKATHQYLGIVLLLGSMHMLFIPSDVSNDSTLKYYMLALAIIGAYSYFYRTILKAYKRGEYKYRLAEVVKVNESVAELKLTPITKKIKYMPGQFVFIRFDIPGVLSESHPFSIASSSTDENLSLGVKALGDYTSMIYLLKPGLICSVEGPFGTFSQNKASGKRQIWVAGGIGVTPFLGMARDLIGKVNGYAIDLYYSVKNEDEAAFADELAKIAEQNNNFKFIPHISEKNGYISADIIAGRSVNISGAEIFLCGPAPFMQNLRKQFINLGFNNNKIHSEEFSLENI